MKAKPKRILANVLICASLATVSNKPAKADSIVPRSEVIAIGIAMGAVGVGIGFGIYYAAHHGHSLTGCTASRANQLELVDKEARRYLLVGNVETLKPGERVRVSGKHVKDANGATSKYWVKQVSRDLGTCVPQS